MARESGKKLAAGIIPVRWCGAEPRVLLLRAYRYWDFPKGQVEADEAPLDAARRELREEAGLTDPEFRWGEIYCETPPYAAGKVARYYLAVCATGSVDLPINPELGRPEHHEFRWTPVPEAATLVGERLRAVLDWARPYILDGEREGSQSEAVPR